MVLNLPTLAEMNAKPHATPKPRPSLLVGSDRRKKRKAVSEKLRAEVRGRDGQQCQACHIPVRVNAANPLHRAQVHHIQYRSKGGKDEHRNLITVCAECHAKIHASELEVIGTNAMNVQFKKVKKAKPGKPA